MKKSMLIKKKSSALSTLIYGLPVLNLNTHIRALENSIKAAEFSKNESLKDELDLLHRALSTREFGERYQGMPKLKRKLSGSQVQPQGLGDSFH